MGTRGNGESSPRAGSSLPRLSLAAVGIWLAVGVLAVAWVALKDIGGLLGDIQSLGRRSYDAGVFTGFKLFFLDTSELADAINLWQAPQTAGLVRRLLVWHFRVDAFAFAPAFAVLAGVLLRSVGATRAFVVTMSASLFVTDEIETLATRALLVGETLQDPGAGGLRVIQLLAFAKWVAIATAMVTLAALWRRPDESSSFRDVVRAVRISRRGEAQSPVIALLGLTVLVLLFAALMALPAGGPLDQIPDAIRYQLSGARAGVLLRAVLAILLFGAAVGAAGLVATDLSGPRSRTGEISTLKVAVGVGLLSALLLIWSRAANGKWSLVPLAPLLVVAVLAAAAWLAGRARVSAPALSRRRRVPVPASWHTWSTLWVGVLVGAVLIATGLGLVRATFRPFLLGVAHGWMPWSIWALVGAAIGILGGPAAQWSVMWAKPRLRRGFSKLSGSSVRRLRPIAIVGVPIVAAGVWLAGRPEDARYIGTTGTIGLSFAFFALLIGSLTWASRTQRRWGVTHSLGFGARTPWMGLLVLTWIVASLLNTEGGYHDARASSELGPSGPRYASLETAFDLWVQAQPEECGQVSGEVMPLVLVAAPGGGIRAAYWTASGLEALFGGETEPNCAVPRLFAISSVSGGSVGAAVWVSARAQRTSARAAVNSMSEDRALAGAAAGLLLRDILQPLTGVNNGWRDRAAILEDGWIESAGVLGTVDDPATWSEVGEGDKLAWIPVLVFNGSSVTDGCRVIVSNAGGLTAAPGSDCYAAPGPLQPPAGPISGAIDPFPGLYSRKETVTVECDGRETGMRTITAALLSARFPVVSPSGALPRCFHERTGSDVFNYRKTYTVTYDVDGGYYENSGLLALLQMWAALEPRVREHNETLGNGELPIEPWIVVLDNHYRSSAKAAEPGRPLELVAPFTTLGTDRVLDEGALEQMAASAMRVRLESCPVAAPAPGETQASSTCRRDPIGFVRLAPERAPSLAAPLGWVLSEASRGNLDSELRKQLGAADSSLARLVGLLKGQDEPEP